MKKKKFLFHNIVSILHLPFLSQKSFKSLKQSNLLWSLSKPCNSYFPFGLEAGFVKLSLLNQSPVQGMEAPLFCVGVIDSLQR